MDNNGDITNDELDFSFLLASSIHEMKNSLAMVLGSISEISYQCMPQNCQSQKQLVKIQHEGRRVNSQLIQLLILYRINKEQYCLNVTEEALSDFLEEVILENQELLELNGLEIELNCPEGLMAYFDTDLVKGILNTIINNAQNYTKQKIEVVASKNDGYTVISVRDDGNGYPEHMLSSANDLATERNRASFSTGSTGLGLYFSSIVADMHRSGQRRGYIELSNNGIDGGGQFTLYLP